MRGNSQRTRRCYGPLSRIGLRFRVSTVGRALQGESSLLLMYMKGQIADVPGWTRSSGIRPSNITSALELGSWIDIGGTSGWNADRAASGSGGERSRGGILARRGAGGSCILCKVEKDDEGVIYTL